MTRKSNRQALDEIKKREIVAILSVGCSRTTAARYVGCTPRTIYNTVRRDPEFAEQLRHAENRTEVEFMRNIQQAARQEKYWRAAAWVLERRNPTDYARRDPGTLTMAQAEQLVVQVATIISECIPAPRYRQILLKRLNQLSRELLGPESQRIEPDEPELPS